jgi:hypothetical protein
MPGEPLACTVAPVYGLQPSRRVNDAQPFRRCAPFPLPLPVFTRVAETGPRLRSVDQEIAEAGDLRVRLGRFTLMRVATQRPDGRLSLPEPPCASD